MIEVCVNFDVGECTLLDNKIVLAHMLIVRYSIGFVKNTYNYEQYSTLYCTGFCLKVYKLQ